MTCGNSITTHWSGRSLVVLQQRQTKDRAFGPPLDTWVRSGSTKMALCGCLEAGVCCQMVPNVRTMRYALNGELTCH
jgi:hypothetical protein